MAASDIAAELRRLAPLSDTSFVLDTLEYMWKGGRCSGVTALGANMLKLKPSLEIRDGKLVVCKKYRGAMEKVYRQYVTERLADKAVVDDWAFITHSGEVSEKTLQELTALVRELAPFKEIFVTQAGCTVSSHCGPGTLGVLFLRQPAPTRITDRKTPPNRVVFFYSCRYLSPACPTSGDPQCRPRPVR